MITKQLKLVAMLFLAALVMVSCSKDDENDETSKTKKEYLTAGNWKVTVMTISPGVNIFGTVITDMYAQMPACTKDDLIKFNNDGSIRDDEGATKCDPNDPQTTTDGTWVFSSDQNSITIDYPDDDPITMQISTLNATTFSGSYEVVEDWGSGELTYTYTITMKLQ